MKILTKLKTNSNDFTLIGAMNHDGGVHPQSKHSRKGGFTLVELIVVMAVIAILVLLAAPKFLNYTEKARAAQIMNDIKVLENKIDEYLINHEQFPDSFASGTPGTGQLYDRTGKIDVAPINLRGVDSAFFNESNLSGKFFTGVNGAVIYEDHSDSESGGSLPQIARVFEDKDVAGPDIGKMLQGAGSESDPYRIWYLEHFDEMDSAPDKLTAHYKLMRDLDFDNPDSYLDLDNMNNWSKQGDSIAGWRPLGVVGLTGYGLEYENKTLFGGNLNGSEYGLYNLYINRPLDNTPVGLFGSAENATIENFSLFNMDIVGNSEVGGIIGYGEYITLSNISATGTILGTGKWSVGGIMGSGYVLEFDTVEIDAKISGYQDIGGVVGDVYVNDYETEMNIFNHVTVKGTIEGLHRFIVKADGNIRSDYSEVGGVAGLAENVEISNSVVHADITGISYAGGIIGYSNELIKFSNIKTYGSISAYHYVGGISGYINGDDSYSRLSIVDDVHSFMGITSPAGEDYEVERVKIGLSWLANAGGLFGGARSIAITNSSSSGDVMFNGFDVGGIVGEGQLIDISNSANYGNIRGLFEAGGILGYLYEGTIENSHNFGKVDTYDISKGFAGGIVGIAGEAVITNSSSNGDVSGFSMVGGGVGFINDSIVKNVSISGDVSGEKHVGGLIGYVDDNIKVDEVSYNGTIRGTFTVGGLIGYAFASGPSSAERIIVRNSYASGEVIGDEYVGGFVGAFNNVTIINSYTTSIISDSINHAGVGHDKLALKYFINEWRSYSGYNEFDPPYNETIGSFFINGEDAVHGTKMTNIQLETASTFSGWDTLIWDIADGQYPTLRKQAE